MVAAGFRWSLVLLSDGSAKWTATQAQTDANIQPCAIGLAAFGNWEPSRGKGAGAAARSAVFKGADVTMNQKSIDEMVVILERWRKRLCRNTARVERSDIEELLAEFVTRVPGSNELRQQLCRLREAWKEQA